MVYDKRIPNSWVEANEDLGFVSTIQDTGRNDLDNDHPVDIYVKPCDLGYQIDVWWTDEDGNRQSNSTHIRLEDPRPAVEIK